MATKKPRDRGPKLFGRLAPRFHERTRTYWLIGNEEDPRRVFAELQDDGPAWSYEWRMEGGGGFKTRESALRGLERSIRRHAQICLALGWQPRGRR